MSKAKRMKKYFEMKKNQFVQRLEILIEQKLQTLIEHVEVFCVFSLFVQ
jgi:phage portal protein BeeE